MICYKNPTSEKNKTKPKYNATASDSDKKMWEFEAKEWITEKLTIKENVKRVWSSIWRKFFLGMQGNIKGLEYYGESWKI